MEDPADSQRTSGVRKVVGSDPDTVKVMYSNCKADSSGGEAPQDSGLPS